MSTPTSSPSSHLTTQEWFAQGFYKECKAFQVRVPWKVTQVTHLMLLVNERDKWFIHLLGWGHQGPGRHTLVQDLHAGCFLRWRASLSSADSHLPRYLTMDLTVPTMPAEFSCTDDPTLLPSHWWEWEAGYLTKKEYTEATQNTHTKKIQVRCAVKDYETV